MGFRYVGERQIVVESDVPTVSPEWKFGKEFADEIVLIVGGGPSHGEMSLELARKRRFIAVNSSCRKVRPIANEGDFLYFSDNSWAENRPELIEDWPGKVVTCNRNAKVRLGDKVLKISTTDMAETLRIRSDCVGASSGHIATTMAALMGAKRIVLIGFECKAVNGKSHGHSDYYQHNLNDYDQRFLPNWRGVALALHELGTEVINATPDSAIPFFTHAPLDLALEV